MTIAAWSESQPVEPAIKRTGGPHVHHRGGRKALCGSLVSIRSARSKFDRRRKETQESGVPNFYLDQFGLPDGRTWRRVDRLRAVECWNGVLSRGCPFLEFPEGGYDVSDNEAYGLSQGDRGGQAYVPRFPGESHGVFFFQSSPGTPQSVRHHVSAHETPRLMTAPFHARIKWNS